MAFFLCDCMLSFMSSKSPYSELNGFWFLKWRLYSSCVWTLAIKEVKYIVLCSAEIMLWNSSGLEPHTNLPEVAVACIASFFCHGNSGHGGKRTSHSPSIWGSWGLYLDPLITVKGKSDSARDIEKHFGLSSQMVRDYGNLNRSHVNIKPST